MTWSILSGFWARPLPIEVAAWQGLALPQVIEHLGGREVMATGVEDAAGVDGFDRLVGDAHAYAAERLDHLVESAEVDHCCAIEPDAGELREGFGQQLHAAIPSAVLERGID